MRRCNGSIYTLSCLKAKKILRPAGIFLPKKYLLVSKKSLAVIQRTVPILNVIKIFNRIEYDTVKISYGVSYEL